MEKVCLQDLHSSDMVFIRASFLLAEHMH